MVMSKNKKLIREKFKSDVFERDNHQCKCCSITNRKW